MIKIVTGDLMKATEDIIGHQVNCRGKMGSGVALQIKKKFYYAYTAYMELVYQHTKDFVGEDLRHTLLGECQIVGLVGNDKWIANLFGQNYYGYDGKTYTSTESLFKAFRELRERAEQSGFSVALPYGIGCYRGGADWNEVESLLLKAFEGYEVTLYKYHEGK